MNSFAFLDLAEWLIENKKCPEGYRSSISRAYYGAFHRAVEFLKEMNITIKSGEGIHAKVPQILWGAGDVEVIAAGKMLDTLRGQRNTADYSLSDTDSENESFARSRLADARSVVCKLDTCKLSRSVPDGRYQKVKAALVKEGARILRNQ